MQLATELAEKLYATFPHLYRGRFKSAQESSMCWGFECGDGWYQLLHDLSAKLSCFLSEHPEVDFEAVQVKSKFGKLHFHLSNHDPSTEAIIEAARQLSSITCEFTGKRGRLCSGKTRRDPLLVLCPEKAVELGYSRVY